MHTLSVIYHLLHGLVEGLAGYALDATLFLFLPLWLLDFLAGWYRVEKQRLAERKG